MHSRNFLDNRRGITVYTLDDQGDIRGEAVTQRGNPDLPNYYVCLDIAGIHFYGVGEDNQTQHDSTILPDKPITPEDDPEAKQEKPPRRVNSPGGTTHDIPQKRGAQKTFIDETNPGRLGNQQLTNKVLTDLLNKKSGTVKGGWELAEDDPEAEQ
jgi:hypothetical protein